MYSYDLRTAAAHTKAFEEALIKAFLKVSPEFDRSERTAPEKAAKSFAKDIVKAFEAGVESRVEAWVDLIASGQKPIQFKTLSTGTEHSSYEDERYDGETVYYSYDVEFPDHVQATKPVRLDVKRIFKYVIEETWLDVELADEKRAIRQVITQSEVVRAFPAFLAGHVKKIDVQGPDYSKLNDAAEEYVGREMFVDPDSSDEDEVSMGIEGHMKVDVGSAEWSVTHLRDLDIAIKVEFTSKIEVLWPDDSDYDKYY